MELTTIIKRCIAALLFIRMALPITAQAANQEFIHPGGLHTQADLDRMKTKVAEGEHPWIDGWNELVKDRKAQSDYQASPHRHMASRQRAQDDASAAYLNALRWYISGDETHAECAARILNEWADTVSEIPHGNDQPGLSGIPIGTFAIAAEVLRLYPGWTEDDQADFKKLLLQYFYPVCHDFLENHNGAPDSNYWANWDTCNMRAIMAIGVFCDDLGKFEEAVNYFKHGRGMGSIENAVPFLYPGGLGQWQESGRDQAHVMGGQGLLAEMCQIAWNQGLDLFGYDNNRLLAGAEYTAQYNLWKGVPYTFYNNASEARQCYVSQNYHGRLDASHFELLYNHYEVRQGIKAPHVRFFAELRRPEPGEVDVLGYGTLVYTLDAAKSPLTTEAPPMPLDVVAAPGLERIELKWSPSGAYSAHGYEVCRATNRDGPYKTIYSTSRWTTPMYTDTDVESGKTYYYTVAALNNAGKSASSVVVSATPAKSSRVPMDFKRDSARATLYADAAGHSFFVPGDGNEMDGNTACLRAEGDFVVTARLINWEGPVGMMGLTVREKGNHPDAIALTLGEVGGRQTRLRTRDGDKTDTQRGNDYTWLPEWFRIQRTGDDFTAYQSDDGIEWHIVGESTMDLPGTVLAGLMVSTGRNPPYTKNEDSPKGFFDHVTIEKTPPAAPAAPANLVASKQSDSEIQLAWRNTADNQTGFKIEASTDGELFYEIADMAAEATSFVNTGLSDPAALTYRIRAYNTGGYSPYSNTSSTAQ